MHGISADASISENLNGNLRGRILQERNKVTSNSIRSVKSPSRESPSLRDRSLQAVRTSDSLNSPSIDNDPSPDDPTSPSLDDRSLQAVRTSDSLNSPSIDNDPSPDDPSSPSMDNHS